MNDNRHLGRGGRAGGQANSRNCHQVQAESVRREIDFARNTLHVTEEDLPAWMVANLTWVHSVEGARTLLRLARMEIL